MNNMITASAQVTT